MSSSYRVDWNFLNTSHVYFTRWLKRVSLAPARLSFAFQLVYGFSRNSFDHVLWNQVQSEISQSQKSWLLLSPAPLAVKHLPCLTAARRHRAGKALGKKSVGLSSSLFLTFIRKELMCDINSNNSSARELWRWAALCTLSNPTLGLMCSERWWASDTAPEEEGRKERIGVISRILNPAETKASHTPTVLCCHCDY